MKDTNHLPMMGVGPIYGIIIIAVTVAGILLSVFKVFYIGNAEALKIPFVIIGILLAIAGIIFWLCAIFHSKIDAGILNNKLVTNGVYAYVRNPIYSAFLMFCTGAILIANDLWLCVLPVCYWLFLTILMKNTEEKWLENLYGAEYKEYCRHTNRCIPWKRK